MVFQGILSLGVRDFACERKTRALPNSVSFILYTRYSNICSVNENMNYPEMWIRSKKFLTTCKTLCKTH